MSVEHFEECISKLCTVYLLYIYTVADWSGISEHPRSKAKQAKDLKSAEIREVKVGSVSATISRNMGTLHTVAICNIDVCHPRGQCSLIDTDKAKCINCSGYQTANYYGCAKPKQ